MTPEVRQQKNKTGGLSMLKMYGFLFYIDVETLTKKLLPWHPWILVGLNFEFELLDAQILGRMTVPSLNAVHAMFLQDECYQNVMNMFLSKSNICLGQSSVVCYMNVYRDRHTVQQLQHLSVTGFLLTRSKTSRNWTRIDSLSKSKKYLSFHIPPSLGLPCLTGE